MKTKYEYIVFVEVSTTKKTFEFECCNIKSFDRLGVVKWYSGWRRYCYFSYSSEVYSEGCLRDIADFIKQLMDLRGKQVWVIPKR